MRPRSRGRDRGPGTDLCYMCKLLLSAPPQLAGTSGKPELLCASVSASKMVSRPLPCFPPPRAETGKMTRRPSQQ